MQLKQAQSASGVEAAYTPHRIAPTTNQKGAPRGRTGMRGTEVAAEVSPQSTAITSMYTNAHSPIANECINVWDAKGNCHTKSVLTRDLVPKTKMNTEYTSLRDSLEFWQYWLKNHPDQQFVNTITSYLVKGIPTGFKGPSQHILSDNWPSAFEHYQAVQSFIDDNLSKGNIQGPLADLPPGYRASPLGAFKRSGSEKIRVIHDLSWPPGRSVNDFISAKDHTLNYTTVDYAANLTSLYDEPWLVKVDLKSAFLSCPILLEDSHLLGFRWPDSRKQLLAYSFTVLPFGLRSSPACFDRYATALQYIMINRGASPAIIHYLDDFLGVAGSCTEAASTLNLMVDTCIAASFKVQGSKTLGPARALEFLGVVIDTTTGQLKISQERMREIRELLESWLGKKNCIKRDLLSLIGKLSFASRVVRSGRLFTSSLIELSKKVKNLHHKVSLTAEAKADLRWWKASIASHNGVAWMEHIWDKVIPIYIYTDASDLAASAILQDSWTVREFTGEHAWMLGRPIVWRELYAVALCLAVFGEKMKGSYIKMYIDNQAAQCCLNSGTSKEPRLVALLRSIYHYTTIHGIHYRSYYLSTHQNEAADSLSRLDWTRFKSLCPNADPHMTAPVDIITL